MYLNYWIRLFQLNRLSKLAGAKLKDNNPNITDLSDPNTPMKIIEHFNEIYDKEWTSSLDILCNECKMEENDAIQTMLETVKVRCTPIVLFFSLLQNLMFYHSNRF